ncbi:LON peptidase substrate-binding domain-containing protein [Rhodanobacter sp. DHG33]|uniref:LON peptidase substrate-binding domain-containing protein n=1 Tax=Rhodanobacter sp. DHG33 TaxID=2775921 RepID=UPI00177AC764|nr:LON peptidase substrate-binding domain-containing protein [Rhodanobacter sp. DHG33]MBD8897337.1 LON peptidase substrate-binding domain-containing protein [Rhodanobacter sp. DHG33]
MAGRSSRTELPLFPLSTVLYPGGRLELRVFEPRYLDLVRECARNESGFGVCLILAGRETGEPALPAAVGTLAHIVDFHHGADGLLGIVAEGGQRFRVRRTRARSDGQLRGEVEWWPEEAPAPVPVELALLQTITERLVEALAPQWKQAPRECYDDARWLGFRLAELLPLGSDERQRLLELTDPLQRLAELRDILPRFQKA